VIGISTGARLWFITLHLGGGRGGGAFASTGRCGRSARGPGWTWLRHCTRGTSTHRQHGSDPGDLSNNEFGLALQLLGNGCILKAKFLLERRDLRGGPGWTWLLPTRGMSAYRQQSSDPLELFEEELELEKITIQELQRLAEIMTGPSIRCGRRDPASDVAVGCSVLGLLRDARAIPVGRRRLKMARVRGQSPPLINAPAPASEHQGRCSPHLTPRGARGSRGVSVLSVRRAGSGLERLRVASVCCPPERTTFLAPAPSDAVLCWKFSNCFTISKFAVFGGRGNSSGNGHRARRGCCLASGLAYTDRMSRGQCSLRKYLLGAIIVEEPLHDVAMVLHAGQHEGRGAIGADHAPIGPVPVEKQNGLQDPVAARGEHRRESIDVRGVHVGAGLEERANGPVAIQRRVHEGGAAVVISRVGLTARQEACAVCQGASDVPTGKVRRLPWVQMRPRWHF